MLDADDRKECEAAFAELGGLPGFLDLVDDGQRSGKLDDSFSADLRWWAENHQRGIDQAAERERIGREWERIAAAWEEYQDAADQAYSSAGSIFDGTGEMLATVTDLEGFAAAVKLGQLIRGNEAKDARRMRAWWIANGGTLPEGNVSGWDDFEKRELHWVIAYDRKRTVPNLQGARLREWALLWRNGVQGLEGSEVVVFAEPGKPVAFVTWWDRPRSDHDACDWAAQLSGVSHDHDDPRFVHVPDGTWTRLEPWRAWPWRVPCTPIYLPSADAIAAPTARAPGARLVTGIAALDGAFRGGRGVPAKARLLVCGDPQQAKTMLLLEPAEAAAAMGWHVLWLSLDDDPDLITIRRLQRAGIPAERAEQLAPADLDRLSECVQVINDQPLESAWEQAHARATAAGAQLLVLADSIQENALCTAAEDKADRAAIEATIEAVKACQRRWPAVFIATSEVTASGTPKGSRDLEYKFDVRLNLRLAGDRLAVSFGKNKLGRTEPFELVADFDAQRLLDPNSAARSKASTELRARIVDVVRKRGARATGERIEQDLEGIDNKVVRAELAAMAANGALLHSPRRAYRLP